MSSNALRPPARKDRTHYLYLAVIGAVIAGATVGLVAPDFAVELKPIGTGFVNLIKMMIAPVIFCTLVLGVGSVAKASQVGKRRWPRPRLLRDDVVRRAQHRPPGRQHPAAG